MRFFNIISGEEKNIEIPENYSAKQIEELLAYQYLEPDEWMQIPDNGTPYKPKETEPFYEIDTEKIFAVLKISLLTTIEIMRKTPFPVAITDINNVQSSYFLNLEDSTILKLLILVKKAEIVGQASEEFINAETQTPEYITISMLTIQQVQAAVIQKDDFLRLKANQVKNAQSLESLQIIQQELNIQEEA
jgi:hypothetical protein